MHSLVASLECLLSAGLTERFDSTIGAGSVLMPFGGRRQLTPIQAMADKPHRPARQKRDHLQRHGLGLPVSVQRKKPFHGAYLMAWWNPSPSWWPPVRRNAR